MKQGIQGISHIEQDTLDEFKRHTTEFEREYFGRPAEVKPEVKTEDEFIQELVYRYWFSSAPSESTLSELFRELSCYKERKFEERRKAIIDKACDFVTEKLKTKYIEWKDEYCWSVGVFTKLLREELEKL